MPFATERALTGYMVKQNLGPTAAATVGAEAAIYELVADLGAAGGAMALTSEPGRYERRRRRERERRMLARVPEWFSADDLVSLDASVIHGERV